MNRWSTRILPLCHNQHKHLCLLSAACKVNRPHNTSVLLERGKTLVYFKFKNAYLSCGALIIHLDVCVPINWRESRCLYIETLKESLIYHILCGYKITTSKRKQNCWPGSKKRLNSNQKDMIEKSLVQPGGLYLWKGLRVRLIKKPTPSGISGMHHSPAHTL